MFLLATLLSILPAVSPATLTYTAPPAWQFKATSSMMRVAEFVLPKAAGDGEDASLVIYFFGGTGGTVQANLDRWFGQLEQPDGRKTRDVATTTSRLINGLSFTLFDATSGPERRQHSQHGDRLRVHAAVGELREYRADHEWHHEHERKRRVVR
jgi:hypothetical protein